MATIYQVQVGLDLLDRAGLPVDTVTAEHRALTPHPIQATGTVANWLAGMPSNVYADVLTEAHRRIGGVEFVRAERAVAVLTCLLPGDHRPLELAELRPYERAFGELVAAIEHSYAEEAVRLLPLPGVLLALVHDVTHLLDQYRLPGPGTGGVILPRLGAAIRSALVWHRALHDQDDTAALLRDAAEQAQW